LEGSGGRCAGGAGIGVLDVLAESCDMNGPFDVLGGSDADVGGADEGGVTMSTALLSELGSAPWLVTCSFSPEPVTSAVCSISPSSLSLSFSSASVQYGLVHSFKIFSSSSVRCPEVVSL